MTRNSTAAAGVPQSPVGRVLDEMTASFERFCLAAGLEVLGEMLEADAAALCGPRHGRGGGRGLAWPLGDEPDAARGDDTPLRPGGAIARGRRAGGTGHGGVEIGGLAA